MKEDFLTHAPLSVQLAKNLYERMVLTRLVNDALCRLHAEESSMSYVSCRGYEAAQIGSAMCIEVGQDFTLPCTCDLGVVLTIGMTPYEVFRTHLDSEAALQQTHWSYHKHNTVTGAAPVATQILHAAGIAFAAKLRKANAVTIAYCGDDVVGEQDFLEGVRFSALHNLPILFICEHVCQNALTTSCLDKKMLPENLTHYAINGTDVHEVYMVMQQAMQSVRAGQGPVLLEIFVAQSSNPLLYAERYMHTQGIWDEEWAAQIYSRLQTEVEQAMHDAVRDIQNTTEKRLDASFNS